MSITERRRVSYSKEQTALAKRNGEALFTVEVCGTTCKKPAMTYQGPMTFKVAQQLTVFCILVGEGKSPRQALKEAFK